ncbi:MAG: S8 family serine peptidase [Cyanobacteria bacterium P01_D01_bin.128]
MATSLMLQCRQLLRRSFRRSLRRSFRASFRHYWGLILGGGSAAIALPAIALSTSVGPDGIDALRLHQAPYNLTGEKIAIGQIEIGRPGQFGLDKVSGPDSPVEVGRVFLIDGQIAPNQYVDIHAGNVASVMISRAKGLIGVAPNATLYSGAVGPLRGRSGQPEECLASQHVALRNGGDVRAINFSFGESLGRDPRPNAVLDGNALLTQCIDWSDREHNLLYVIAGNQGSGGIPIPTDNFNGINVAFSVEVDGRFSRVDYANLSSEPAETGSGRKPETNVGPRRSINLVAPGANIEMIDPSGRTRFSTGTSFAAPHVVATVALLQEFGDRQIRSSAPNWSLDSRRAEVTKAVILNAADKLEDEGDGLRLGMSRTLLDESNQDWRAGDAYRDRRIPLHVELGTGHLNAFRAYQQMAAGQWSAGLVPAIGWNYDRLSASGYQDYAIEQSLVGGSFISATLSWDRIVLLNDTNQNGQYDIGETFNDQGMNNLDLYLLRADDDDIANSVWSSESEFDSLEHLFFQIPETGRYKLRVVYRQQLNPVEQDYALAWWAVPASAPDN